MSFNVLEYAAVNKNAVSYSYDKPVIGLDRDGVINFNDPTGGYVWKREQFIPIPGSLEAVALIRNKGYRIVIITNQGGIDKGLYTMSDVDYLHQYMFELLGQAGCPSVDGLYYAASSDKGDPYAKPNTGMFKRAENELPGIKFSEGWYVGDSMRDLKAANKMNTKLILVRTGHGIETEQELKKFTYKEIKKKVAVYDNLLEFAKSLS
jgi:D-glycero-D-manno-heptose 1,7-bisphosphate phosphatase